MAWNKPSYHQRLFLWLLGYSLLLMGCVVVFQYRRELRFKADELNSQLQLVNMYVLNELASGCGYGDVDVSEISPFPDIRISVIDQSGRIVYDNSLDSIPGDGGYFGREEIAHALRSGAAYTVRRLSESTGETYFYSATVGDSGIIVRSAVPYSVTLSGLLSADYGFLQVMGGVTVIMCVLGFFATRRVGNHISKLNQFAEKAEAGEKIYDTEPFPRDELGEISNHIVRLYARLQQAVVDRDREHKSAMYEQREKERIKKQLTNNINHELKTPVASIQVCLETILSHPELSDDKRKEFLQRCLFNTGRLRSLLADVSLITRMDDGGEAISREMLDLADVIAEVVTDSLPAAENKGITICNGIDRRVEMTGNASLLASVFRNLIDNAIAYSGGDSINVRFLRPFPDGKVVIEFTDNGCGIPDEHLPRIFERFYRVDKGRSRQAGGTGLGLSIVRNAVIFHGGDIRVENRPEGGLSFRITFPGRLL